MTQAGGRGIVSLYTVPLLTAENPTTVRLAPPASLSYHGRILSCWEIRGGGMK